jgi:hypothetical protein
LKISYLISFFTVAIISIYVWGFWSLEQVHARTSTAVNFLTYRNPTLGFFIGYPTDWKINENTISGEKGVTFTPPDRDIPAFYVRIRQATPYLDTDTMTVKNKTVQQVVQQMMNNLSKPNPFGLESKLIRQNQFTVAGNAGWKMELFFGPQANPFYYGFEVLTIANGKVYYLEYQERPLKVPETLPLVNKMVESFHLIR